MSFGAQPSAAQSNTGLALNHAFALLNLEDFPESTEAKMLRWTISTNDLSKAEV